MAAVILSGIKLEEECKQTEWCEKALNCDTLCMYVKCKYARHNLCVAFCWNAL